MINIDEIRINEQILRNLTDGKFPIIVKGSFINAYLYPNPLERLRLSDGVDFIAAVPVHSEVTTLTPVEVLLEETGLTDFERMLGATIATATGEEPVRTHEIFVEKDFSTLRLYYQTSGSRVGIDIALNEPHPLETVPFDCPSLTGEPFRRSLLTGRIPRGSGQRISRGSRFRRGSR